jgi:hypothetical protein
MKTRSNIKPLGTRTILGRRVSIGEYINVRFYRIGTCNIQAADLETAVARYIECKSKEGAK